MKVMAIDLGDVRTGVAVSDVTGFIAGRSVTKPSAAAIGLWSLFLK